jgi:hypothetical protein
VDINSGVCTDSAGNNNTAAAPFSRTYDNSFPTVSITSSVSAKTNISPMPVTVTFSETVTGFIAGDIGVDNGTVSDFATSDNRIFTFNLTPVSEGQVKVNIPPNVAQDSSGNNNSAAPQFDRIYDSSEPSVVVTSTAPPYTGVSPIPVTITFSEVVTGFIASDIYVINGTAGNLVSSDNKVFTADIMPVSQGTVTIGVNSGVCTDSAGNNNTASINISRIYDSYQPSVVITSSASDPTSVSPIPVTVTFDETVQGFSVGDIVLTNGTASGFSSSGDSLFSIQVTPASQGQVSASVPAGVCTDNAGNVNTASAQLTVTFDNIAPALTGVCNVVSVNTSTVTLSWPSASDQHFARYEIWYGMAAEDVLSRSRTAILYGPQQNAALSVITASGAAVNTVSDGMYAFKLWAIDSAGNESSFAPVQARVDLSAPDNNARLTLSAILDTAITIRIRTDNVKARDVKYVRLFGALGTTINDTAQTGIRFTAKLPFMADTTIRFIGLGARGMWYVASLLEDSTGLRSAIVNDSIKISNSRPRLDVPDTLVAYEDSLWSYTVTASDSDNDAVTFGLRLAPSCIGLTPSTGIITWMPGNADVGKYPVVIWAADTRRDTVTDTFSLVVRNVNDKPVIDSVFTPDSVKQDETWTGRISVNELDAGDSLTAHWISPLSWLNSLSISRNAASESWSVSFSGIPAKTDTGWNRFEINVKDKSGVTAAIRDSVYVIRVNRAPQVKIQSRRVIWGSAQFKLEGSDDRDTILRYQAALTGISGNAVKINNPLSTKLTGAVFEYYPLVDGRYVFSCFVIDSDSLWSLSPAADTFTITGASSHSFAVADTTWQMLSVPGASFSAQVLKNNGYLAHWDETRSEDKVYKYYAASEEINSTVPGSGYWRQSGDTVSISLTRGQMVDSSVSIRLAKSRYGWNQIGSPYPYPVKWPGTEVVWKWNDAKGDYDEDPSGVLYPWEGCFVLVDSSQTIRISSEPAFTVSGQGKRLKAHFSDIDNWQVKVRLSEGSAVDNDNVFGFSGGAADGKDMLDRPEPPRMNGVRYMYFSHPEWRYAVDEFASDVRRRFGEINVFEAGIAPSSYGAGSKTVMDFFDVKELSGVYLFVATGDSLVMVKEGAAIQVAASSNETMFTTIIATSDKNLANRFPVRFVMRNPYPNPFRNNVTLQYTLPYRWEKNGKINIKPYEVSVKIFDARGRLVKSLADRKQEPGDFRMAWDAKGNTGRICATGNYIVVLKADRFSANRRIVLVK